MALLSGALLLAGCGLTPTELKKMRPPSLPQPQVAPLAAGELPKITVIPAGTEPYWDQARQGAVAAGKKFGARIEWKVPTGDVITAQKKMVENVMTTSQGLVLAPADPTKLMQPVGDAARAGVVVVAFDRDVFTIGNKLTFVHNDEEQSGIYAANEVGKFLSKSYKVEVFPAPKNDLAAMQRIDAFENTMRGKFPDAELQRLESLPEIMGGNVFIPDSYLSLLNRYAQRPNFKLNVIAFGADEELLQAVKIGKISALITPDYYQMGFQSVKAIMDFRATKQMPPPEIKIAPRVLTRNTSQPASGSKP